MAKSTVAVTKTAAPTFGEAFGSFFNEDSVVTTPSVEAKTVVISSTAKKATGVAAIFVAGVALGTSI